MRHVIAVLVENEFGVLARIAGLFSGRGFNIDSLTVSETLDPTISRMTIISEGSQRVIEQILKQLDRLINVIKVEDLGEGVCLERELVLMKVQRQAKSHADFLKAVEAFGGRIVEDEAETYIVEFTGDESTLDNVLTGLKPFGILEFVCSGSLALHKGDKVL